MKQQINEKYVQFDMIFALKKKKRRENVGGEGSLEIKHLPHKCDDLSLDPQTPA